MQFLRKSNLFICLFIYLFFYTIRHEQNKDEIDNEEYKGSAVHRKDLQLRDPKNYATQHNATQRNATQRNTTQHNTAHTTTVQ